MGKVNQEIVKGAGLGERQTFRDPRTAELHRVETVLYSQDREMGNIDNQDARSAVSYER